MQKLSNLTQGQVLWLLHDRQPFIPSYSVWLAGVQWVMAPTSKAIGIGYIEVQYFSETNTYQVSLSARNKPIVPEVVSRALTGSIDEYFMSPVDISRLSIWFRNTNLIPNRADFKSENLDFITYNPKTQSTTAFIVIDSEPVGALGEAGDPTA